MEIEKLWSLQEKLKKAKDRQEIKSVDAAPRRSETMQHKSFDLRVSSFAWSWDAYSGAPVQPEWDGTEREKSWRPEASANQRRAAM